MGPYALQSCLVLGYHALGLPVGSHGADPNDLLSRMRTNSKDKILRTAQMFTVWQRTHKADKTAMKNVDA